MIIIGFIVIFLTSLSSANTAQQEPDQQNGVNLLICNNCSLSSSNKTQQEPDQQNGVNLLIINNYSLSSTHKTQQEPDQQNGPNLLINNNYSLSSVNMTQQELDQQNGLNFLIHNNYLADSFISNENDNQVLSMSTLNVEQQEEIKDALIYFQNFYKLPSTGEWDDETLQLMKTSRICDVPDIMKINAIDNFAVVPERKWKKTNLKWKFLAGSAYTIPLTRMAFDEWERHTNLKFEYTRGAADIVISFQAGEHKFRRCCNYEQCTKFDGPGVVLGHATMPPAPIVEIHMDQDEKWDYSSNGNFFAVMLHEIGHTLGLSHSGENKSVMFNYYDEYNIKLQLHEDDILGLQTLYGIKNGSERMVPIPPFTPVIQSTSPSPKTTTAAITKTTMLTSTAPNVSDEEKIIDICDVVNKINVTFVMKRKLWLFYNENVWMYDLKTKTLLEPALLRKHLTFLEPNFGGIVAIYENFQKDIVLITKTQEVYIMNGQSHLFKNSSLVNYYFVDLPKNSIIDAAFTTYTGKTFLFHDKMYCSEVSGLTGRRFSKTSFIYEIFPSIPDGLDGAFRFIDGNLYFIKGSQVILYNEFTESIIKSKSIQEMFNVNCPNTSIMEDLKLLLNKILFRQINIQSI